MPLTFLLATRMFESLQNGFDVMDIDLLEYFLGYEIQCHNGYYNYIIVRLDVYVKTSVKKFDLKE